MPAPLVLLLIIAGAVAAWFPLTWRVMQVGCVLLAGVLALCLLTRSCAHPSGP
ncbi:hypothetical protein ACFSC4_17815 [Deinococcus malanensis]|uniref:hypothetical protein n=1 Tax=Deinococcus malanensis TaxID=1706855 RepID=UPI0036353339